VILLQLALLRLLHCMMLMMTICSGASYIYCR